MNDEFKELAEKVNLKFTVYLWYYFGVCVFYFISIVFFRIFLKRKRITMCRDLHF